MERQPVISLFTRLVIVGILLFTSLPASSPGTHTASLETDPSKSFSYLPFIGKEHGPLMIRLGQANDQRGIFLDQGGDVDTQAVWAGAPPEAARRTGNDSVLPSPDGNQIRDSYMQFGVSDSAIFAGIPTQRLQIEIDYLDQGADRFIVQYDSTSGGPFGDGRFKATQTISKTNTGRFQTARFQVCDAYFANRDNQGDLRIDDLRDGAETIRQMKITLQSPGPATIHIDTCGANPWDSLPDSDAIQACIELACDGDTILFTSGGSNPAYQGYNIDKTIFLVPGMARRDLTFTSTDPANPALLKATAALKGFVMRLYPMSWLSNPGEIDDITVSYLHLNGGRDVRRCFGADGVENGLDDNWGSWLPECSEPGNPWCRAGTLAMEGVMDFSDPTQDYLAHPAQWTTGLSVEGVTSSNTECGTAITLSGAGSRIVNSTARVAGDHVHVPGCTPLEADEGVGDWSDGITFVGPGHVVSGNFIRDASDVGIVFFGGRNTVISHNMVQVSPGHYGMFAGIALHGWIFGDMSGVQVLDNQVTSAGDSTCGGIHAGINLGTHMWAGGCVLSANPLAIGNANLCQAEPAAPLGNFCTAGQPCQVWTSVQSGWSLTLQNNYVAGAQVNYLIEGLDLAGALVEAGNTSGPPRRSDWETARNGCAQAGSVDSWGTFERVAHHPALAGWVDQRIHCER